MQLAFGNVSLLESHYTTDGNMLSFYRNVKSTKTVQKDISETFIIRNNVLQHSSDTFPLILFNTVNKLSTFLYIDNTKASTVSNDNTTAHLVQ